MASFSLIQAALYLAMPAPRRGAVNAGDGNYTHRKHSTTEIQQLVNPGCQSFRIITESVLPSYDSTGSELQIPK